MIEYILFFTFLASVSSLFLVSLFLFYQKAMKRISFHLVAFAAGALLATGITDTLPEAIERNKNVYVLLTLFIALFFVIEKIFLHLHHHEAEEGETKIRMPLSFLLFGDGLHNFIDGLSIASTFLVSFPLGILTSIAVFVHEIPHELGDFGILLHMGYKRKKILIFNLLTGIMAVFGALLGYFIAKEIKGVLPLLLTLTSANFIYLSLSDLLPEIYDKTSGKVALSQTAFFLFGVLFIIIMGYFFR